MCPGCLHVNTMRCRASPGMGSSEAVALADLDADGDLDAFAGGDKEGRIWLNDGRGFFTDSRQEINYSSRHAATLGDVDGDGTLDVVAGKLASALV
jgi:hypothetical protein